MLGKPNKMKRLTDILWPGMRELALEEIDAFANEPGQRRPTAKKKKVAALEAAVMFEEDWTDMCHTVWCTAVPQDRVQRLMARAQS